MGNQHTLVMALTMMGPSGKSRQETAVGVATLGSGPPWEVTTPPWEPATLGARHRRRNNNQPMYNLWRLIVGSHELDDEGRERQWWCLTIACTEDLLGTWDKLLEGIHHEQ